MEKDLDLKDYKDRVGIVKNLLSKLDNDIRISDNDNKYLYDITVSVDDVVFGASIRSGNFEKTKGFIDYKEKLTRFVDKVEKPIIIFYVNKVKGDVFISPIINYNVGDLQVEDEVSKRALTQRNIDMLRDKVNVNKL